MSSLTSVIYAQSSMPRGPNYLIGLLASNWTRQGCFKFSAHDMKKNRCVKRKKEKCFIECMKPT